MHTSQASETANVSESYNASPLPHLFPLPECADPDTVDALPEAEVSYQALFEFHPHPMWITDYETLRFLLVNEAAIKHYGYSEVEFLAMTLKDICPPEDFPTMLKSRMAKLPQKGRLGVWRHTKKNGAIIHVEVTARDFRFQGRSARLALVNDITERRKAEESLKQSEQAYRQLAEHLAQEKEQRDRLFTAKQEADLANQAKSEFLSRMSHELRTPLNAILGFGQILEQQPLNALQIESVQYILKGGRHLLDLINEVLDIARVESGQIDLSLEPISIAELVAESCLLLRPLAAERHIFLDADTASFGQHHVLADRQRLKQVLINLLSNAIKYNRTGGQVRIYGIAAHENRLRIAIQDTGLGMTPEEQQKLFTPFERLSAAHSEVEGTGLGLVLSQRLVTTMGGSLTLDSVLDEGTTFFIELPSAPPPEEALALNLNNNDTPHADLPVQQATILTIEDNPSNLRLLEVLLRGRPGTTLLVAMQGSIGLDLARQHKPDLILLDLNLPDISGREVLSRLRTSDQTQDIPIVVLSADATSSQIERLLHAGAQAYLTKPLDIAEFMDTLDRMLPTLKTS